MIDRAPAATTLIVKTSTEESDSFSSGVKLGTASDTPKGKAGWLGRLWKKTSADNPIAYRHLAMQLHFELPRQEHRRVVLMVTPGEPEPNPRSAMALALALADELQQKVLLADACTRSPALTKAAGASLSSPGFSNLSNSDGLSMSSLALPSNHPLVSFLPVGTGGDAAASTPENLESIVSPATREFDFIVFSAGSVLHDPVSLALAPLAGCVLLSVAENLTRKSDLTAAKNLLDACRARKVALVLNAKGRRNLHAF